MREVTVYRDHKGVLRVSKFVLCPRCGKVVRTGATHTELDGSYTIMEDDTDPIVEGPGIGTYPAVYK